MIKACQKLNNVFKLSNVGFIFLPYLWKERVAWWCLRWDWRCHRWHWLHRFLLHQRRLVPKLLIAEMARLLAFDRWVQSRCKLGGQCSLLNILFSQEWDWGRVGHKFVVSVHEERVLLHLSLLEDMRLRDRVRSRRIYSAELPWLQEWHLNIRLLSDADQGCSRWNHRRCHGRAA